VNEYALPYVCITGGEPLLQEEAPLLAGELVHLGYTVSIETNGTIDASEINETVKRIIDIKCPGSGEAGKTAQSILENRRATDEFKFVLTDYTDFRYAITCINKHNLGDSSTILLSPAWGMLEPAHLAEWIIDERAVYRLNVQLHRYIWPDSVRGR
jgi:7-carboxy-7-deazaguanine synthase